MWYVWPSTAVLLNYTTLLLKKNMVTSPEVQGDLKSMFPDSKWLPHVEVWLPNP
jgi:hypothetical protein